MKKEIVKKGVETIDGIPTIVNNVIEVDYVELSSQQIFILNKMINILQNIKLNTATMQKLDREQLYYISETICLLKCIIDNGYINSNIEISDIVKYSCTHMNVGNISETYRVLNNTFICKLCGEVFEKLNTPYNKFIIQKTLNILQLFSSNKSASQVINILKFAS